MKAALSIRRSPWSKAALGRALLFGLLLVRPTSAQTKNSYPMLMSLQPVAAQVGQSSVHELRARYNLAGASAVLVSGEGVVAEVVPDDSAQPESATRNDVADSTCRIKFTVASDALPGVRDFRVFTPHGVSTVGQLVVARDPGVIESPENDTVEQAQSINIPCTLCGAVEKPEDIDYFRFSVPAGSAWTYHVRSQRLLNRLHDMQSRIDPIIAIRNDQGKIIASSDNYYAGDPLLHCSFQQGGDYLLEVRDVRYQGNVDWAYSIEIHSRPYVTQVFPNAVPRTAATCVSLIGHQLPSGSQASLQPSVELALGPQWLTPTFQGVPLNEVAVWITDGPVQVESTAAAPPHEAAGAAHDAPPTDSPGFDLTKLPGLTWPGTMSGRIAQEGEVDRFAFQAKAQDKLSFQVFARRGGSELDPILRILNAQGAALAEADDGTFERVNHADCWLEGWTAPADGDYVLELRDLHQRGGERFPYAVQVSQAVPYFQLEVDTDKTLLAPGMGSALFVRTLRKNGFAGEIQLGVDGLPADVTMIPGRILADGNDGCIVLLASETAAATAAKVNIYGTADIPTGDGQLHTLRVDARPLQEYYSPGGGRGNYPVDAHVVSIANPMDIRAIRLSTRNVELMPGGSQRIDVTIERAPDYQGNVTLDVLLQHLEQHFGDTLPKGVTVDVAASKTLLTAGDSAGFITLVAAPDAPEVTQQIVPVLAHVSINFVMKHTFCVEPLVVSVRKPTDRKS